MCGIAGFFGARLPDEVRIQATLSQMRRRGPDIQTQKCLPYASHSLALLHSRLAIIDLDPRSNQPFEREACVLIFNGEIYNYLEVKKKLIQAGRRFTTESDTEVLLEAYLTYGESFVEHLEGMWAFALYDGREKKLLLSRDRFGEKPLFLLRTQEGLYFGSEVKFLQALSGNALTPNKKQILRYLVHGYKSLHKHKEYFFEEIESLPAASLRVIREDLSEKTSEFWKLSYRPQAMSRQEAVAGIRERLLESLRIRLRSDVPLAFCLSGGIDSGGIVSMAAKHFHAQVSCYSILDPDERYNEEANIRAVVQDTGCEWTSVRLEKETNFDRLRDLIRYHDAPVVTLSYYIHSFLMKLVADHGKKVSFSGTSADELFAGYYDHYLWHLREMHGRPEYNTFLADWKTHVLPKTRNPMLQDPENFLRDKNFHAHIYLDAQEFQEYLKVPFEEHFVQEHFCEDTLRNRMLNELFCEATPVILAEDDLNAMRYSIENRSPYLDSELARFAFTIPTEHLIVNGYNKSLLRDALDGFLTDSVRLDRQKKGFNAAIESVFALSDGGWRESMLDESPIFELVDRTKIEALTRQDGFTNSWSKFLFSFLSAKIFLEEQLLLTK